MKSLIPRLHLFEFHDFDWFPAPLRNGITECLRVLSNQLALEYHIAPILSELIRETGRTRLIDICSGACGPVIPLQRALASSGHKVAYILTDKYPNKQAFTEAELATAGAIQGYANSVDATSVPLELAGIRTLFNSFHHFSPERARALLEDAYNKRQPIAIFEITDRSLFRTLTNFPASFLLMLASVPRMRPMHPLWWLLSYIVPILPSVFAWDGLVSCLRSYTSEELHTLARGLDTDYQWRSGAVKLSRGAIRLTYFVGLPTAKAAAAAACFQFKPTSLG